MTMEKFFSQSGKVRVKLGPGGDDPDRQGGQTPRLPDILPILPVRDMSMFPRMVLPMLVAEDRHQKLVDEVVSGNKIMGLVGLKDGVSADDVKSLENLHQVGVAAMVLKMAKMEGEGAQLVAQGLTRFRILDLVAIDPYIKAKVVVAHETPADDTESRALISNLKALFKRVQNLSPHLPEEILALIASIPDPGALCDMIASALSIGTEERQTIVEALDIKERLRRVTALTNHEIQILELGSKIQNEVKEGLDKTQREYYLRQQLKTIQKELAVVMNMTLERSKGTSK